MTALLTRILVSLALKGNEVRESVDLEFELRKASQSMLELETVAVRLMSGMETVSSDYAHLRRRLAIAKGIP